MSQRTFAYSGFAVGQVTLNDATATQLPDLPCKEVILKSAGGLTYYGPDNSVTSATGFPVDDVVGGESPPIYVGNLNQIWAIAGTGGTGPIAYMAQF